MPPACPQCHGSEWALVHFCIGCGRKVNGPVTLVLHECPAAAPATAEIPAPPPPVPSPAPALPREERALSAYPC